MTDSLGSKVRRSEAVADIPVVVESALKADMRAGAKAASLKTEDQRQDLLSLNRAGMFKFMASLGEKPYRANQVMKWIYQQGVVDFDEMSDLSKKSRGLLKEKASVELPTVQVDDTASDGTRKWLFQLSDGNSIETVFIPEGARGTLCISSQVGCALDCSFCATGRQGFNRNLSTGEIIAQLWLANHLLGVSASQKPGDVLETPVDGPVGDGPVVDGSVVDGSVKTVRKKNHKHSATRVTNVVMMGMGEPLLNFSGLVPSLELMMDDLAFGLSKRKVTVSTSGVVPAMDRLNQAIDCSLAVSLHAPNDELRDQLVPLNRKYPIEELMGACRRYVDGDRRKHIFFEYVLLAGVNDQPEHARQLAKLLRDFPAKVNLIPFNPFEESGYKRSSEAAIERFWRILTNAGVLTLRRSTRGDDIDAACGQLAGDIEDRSRRHRKFSEPRFGEQFT